jgi:hypothetical protein
MVFNVEKVEFDTFAQWYTWGMGINIIKPDKEQSSSGLYCFFEKLYEDMYGNPERYSIPVETYPDEIEFNRKRLNVSRVIRNVVLDFLYRIGQMGVPEMGTLKIEPRLYRELAGEKSKKVRYSSFLAALEQLGLQIDEREEVTVSSAKYPQMPSELSLLSKACARDRVRGLFHFQRCDYRTLEPKVLLNMNDVFKILPEALGKGVNETDIFLSKLKFKRKIEPYYDFGYRISYSNKAGVVCYFHINSYFNESLYIYIRWVLDTRQSTRFFDIVEEHSKGYSDYIFNNLCKCDPDCVPGFGASSPEVCIARIKLEYNGRTEYACKDARYNKFGKTSRDFIYVQTVLKAMDEVLYGTYGKKNSTR